MKLPEELLHKSRIKISGIYKIQNNVNGKFYIGSSNHLYRRFLDHKKYLSRGIHSNPRLQNSWNKYGSENFSFEIVEYTSSDKILNTEQDYINRLNPFFNIAKEVGFPATPKAGTAEAKERSRKNVEARKKSEWCNSKELHEIMSGKMKERWKDEEYRSSRSVKTKDLWSNPVYRNNLSNAHKKIGNDDRKRVKRLVVAGFRIKDLMKHFGISRMTISRIASET